MYIDLLRTWAGKFFCFGTKHMTHVNLWKKRIYVILRLNIYSIGTFAILCSFPSYGSEQKVSRIWSSSTSCHPSLYHLLYHLISQSQFKGLPIKYQILLLFFIQKIAYCLYFRRNIFIWNVHICCYVFLDTYYGCRGAWVCPILAPSDCKIGPSVHYSTVSATPTSEDLQRSHQGFCVYWNWPDECIIHFILTSNEDKWK